VGEQRFTVIGDAEKAERIADEIREILNNAGDLATGLTALGYVLGDAVFVCGGKAEMIFPTLQALAEKKAQLLVHKATAEALECEGIA
jgi:hypothetical protein